MNRAAVIGVMNLVTKIKKELNDIEVPLAANRPILALCHANLVRDEIEEIINIISSTTLGGVVNTEG